MGKKPVLGLAGLFLAGVTLSGCQNSGGGRGGSVAPPPMMGAKNSATPDSRPNMVPGPRPDLASVNSGAPRGGTPANPVSPVSGSTGAPDLGGSTVVPVGAGSALGNPGSRPMESFGSGGSSVPSSFQKPAASGVEKPLPAGGTVGSISVPFASQQGVANSSPSAMPTSFKSDPVYAPSGIRTPINPSGPGAMPATGASSTTVGFTPPAAPASEFSTYQTNCPAGSSPTSNGPATGASIPAPQQQPMPSLSPNPSGPSL
jgi:hypothetical protein